MKIPNRIQPLVDDGLVDDVISRLMSGKEADVYVVRCGDEIRCAKVYKEASKRSFKQAVVYQEGRKVRGSRDARAMEKGLQVRSQAARRGVAEHRGGCPVQAGGGRGAGAQALCLPRWRAADGAHHRRRRQRRPRLNDVALTREQAVVDHGKVIRYVVRMLCAGLIHGDLSEFNVLVDEEGPVIIDLPQVVDAAANNQARAMLERDVDNMRNYYGMYAPELLKTRYAREMWSLFEDGKLGPETELTGLFEESREAIDLDGVLHEIESAQEEAMARRARLQAEQEEES
jgi:RIO kinase 1